MPPGCFIDLGALSTGMEFIDHQELKVSVILTPPQETACVPNFCRLAPTSVSNTDTCNCGEKEQKTRARRVVFAAGK